MKSAAVLLAAAAGASFLSLAPRPAFAVEECFASVPLQRDGTLPAPDRTGVPINARVVARLSGRTHREAYALGLRVAGGAEVAATTRDVSSGYLKSAVILTPDAPLQPNTAYEIVDDLDAASTCDDAPESIPCDEAATHLAVVSSFTTGDHADTTPPWFTPHFTIHHDEQRCDVPECCGAYHAFTYDLSWPAATDDEGGDVLYEVVMGSSPTPAVEAVAGLAVAGADYCSIDPTTEGGGPDVRGPGPAIVRAVDLAGNATAADPVELQVPACPPEHDAGPLERDGGFHVDGGGVPPYPGHGLPLGTGMPGCCCTVGHAGGGSGLASVTGGVLLALGALTWRARRRR